jgi:hypothetical protein
MIVLFAILAVLWAFFRRAPIPLASEIPETARHQLLAGLSVLAVSVALVHACLHCMALAGTAVAIPSGSRNPQLGRLK